MTTTEALPVWMRPSARDLYVSGFGQAALSPTDADLAAAIRRELAAAISNDTFGEPVVQAALLAAAQAVRRLLSSTTAKGND